MQLYDSTTVKEWNKHNANETIFDAYCMLHCDLLHPLLHLQATIASEICNCIFLFVAGSFHILSGVLCEQAEERGQSNS